MTFEPLKNKRKTIFGEKIKIGKNEGIIFWNLPFTELDGFEYKNVKSAVEGCKEELLKHRNHYRKSNPAIANFIDSFLVDFDKWFEDVI